MNGFKQQNMKDSAGDCSS